MNKRIKKKKRKQCDFCSKLKQTQEIYGDLEICRECKEHDDRISAISSSIEG
ncbi:hypothetical protein J5Y03_10195 [Bacillus sp. RG28]|uniref:Uncharacterized protein n=1 Tax=Gottfriedia endophytica TaxID=2820819 RepID=A0A940NQ79_9BACI|nr:hypothetical protein [Gottfriedia endophytica]MBP0725558.1 hypothetical protein [Gottfriedia endophytica]